MTQVLENIHVLDFSRIFAGPDATQVLGDLGADVVKVEDPHGGDACRSLGVTQEELLTLGGDSPAFHSFNRNKRSITLDLGTAEGQKVAFRLASRADIILNNFRPGTMERWGLGYDDLSQSHPELIYCDFHAYGSEGQMSHIGANDLAVQAHSGLMSITGEENGPPARSGSAIIDLHASLAIVSAILAALLHRANKGHGQRVDTSLLLSSAHLMSYLYMDYWMTGKEHRRMGTGNHLSVPNQAFPTQDGYVVIIAPSDEMWNRCANALSPEELLKDEFKTASERLRLRTVVYESISAVTKRMTSAEVYRRLNGVKVNVSLVQEIGEAAEHPQLVAAGGIFTFDAEDAPRKYVATPFRLHGTPPKMQRNAPKLGEHTAEILTEAGYSEIEITQLQSAGVITR